MEERTQDPCFIVACDDHGRSQGKHHAEIRECKVDDQKVGRCPQCLGGTEDVYDHTVTEETDDPQNTHNES